MPGGRDRHASNQPAPRCEGEKGKEEKFCALQWLSGLCRAWEAPLAGLERTLLLQSLLVLSCTPADSTSRLSSKNSHHASNGRLACAEGARPSRATAPECCLATLTSLYRSIHSTSVGWL